MTMDVNHQLCNSNVLNENDKQRKNMACFFTVLVKFDNLRLGYVFTPVYSILFSVFRVTKEEGSAEIHAQLA